MTAQFEVHHEGETGDFVVTAPNLKTPLQIPKDQHHGRVDPGTIAALIDKAIASQSPDP